MTTITLMTAIDNAIQRDKITRTEIADGLSNFAFSHWKGSFDNDVERLQYLTAVVLRTCDAKDPMLRGDRLSRFIVDNFNGSIVWSTDDNAFCFTGKGKFKPAWNKTTAKDWWRPVSKDDDGKPTQWKFDVAVNNAKQKADKEGMTPEMQIEVLRAALNELTNRG